MKFYNYIQLRHSKLLSTITTNKIGYGGVAVMGGIVLDYIADNVKLGLSFEKLHIAIHELEQIKDLDARKAKIKEIDTYNDNIRKQFSRSVFDIFKVNKSGK